MDSKSASKRLEESPLIANGSSANGSSSLKSADHDSIQLHEVIEVPSHPTSSNPRSCRCCCLRVSLIAFLFIFNLIALAYFIVIPFTFRGSEAIQREILFLNSVMQKVGEPGSYDLNCTSQLRVNSTDNVTISLWHIPPSDECAKYPNRTATDWLASTSTSGPPTMVVLYAHGNGGTITTRFRTALYRMLTQRLQYHVVAYDYRGFGDSSDVAPCVAGVTADDRAIYQWILDQGTRRENILLWGHSLGTAVHIRMASTLEYPTSPAGIILEAPFTNMDEEIREFPAAKLFRPLPYFDYCFHDPLVNNPEFNFDSISLLPLVRSPLLILHAADDRIVPLKLGEKLYERAKKAQPEAMAVKTKMHEFAAIGYGHNKMIQAPELPGIVFDWAKTLR